MKKLTFTGTDASNEISLLEYGLLVSNEEHEDNSGTHFCIYAVGELFGTGHISEKEVNGYVQGKEFPDAKEIKSFLSFVGCTKKEWLKMSLVYKLSDLLQYWGSENIMGTDYYLLTLKDLQETYNLGF